MIVGLPLFVIVRAASSFVQTSEAMKPPTVREVIRHLQEKHERELGPASSGVELALGNEPGRRWGTIVGEALGRWIFRRGQRELEESYVDLHWRFHVRARTEDLVEDLSHPEMP